MKQDDDPLELFAEWYGEAQEKEAELPTAVALATASADGSPSVRMVLLKGFDERGFVFYTNLASRKGDEISANPGAALCFHWKSTRKQVRVEGTVVPVPDEEADAYFASRDRASQLGAWASKQSKPMQGRFELETAVAKTAARFLIGTVPRPDFWSGFRIRPNRIEFWREGKFRLHERLDFCFDGSAWSGRNLYP